MAVSSVVATTTTDAATDLLKLIGTQRIKDLLALLAQIAEPAEQKQPLTTIARPVVPLLASGVKQSPADANVNASSVTQNNATNIINITIQNNTTITPWDSPEYITVSLADILAAFAENPKLQQYLHMDDFELTNFEKAPPFIIELFIELVLRAHLIEMARNIYLNPSRSDQVMVRMKSGAWDVAPLNDAIEHLFNGVATRLHQITITTAERTKLPYDIQNAISMCEMMYRGDPDLYIKLAKEVLVAHLTNCRARLIEAGIITQRARK
jgi:hypothetical protein